MKRIFIILFFSIINSLHSQESRWFSHADVEVMIPRSENTKYSFSKKQLLKEYFEGNEITREYPHGYTKKMSDKPAFSLNYSFNYQFWDGLSFGVVTGLYHLPLPEATLSAAKFGGQFRYTFDEDYKASMYIQVVGFLPLNKYVTTELGEARFGMTFPIIDNDEYVFTATLYTSYVSFQINKPLLYDEKPDIVESKGFGIGLGIRF